MSGGNFNAIAGAVIASVLGVMGLGIVAEEVFHPTYPEKAGFAPDVSAESTGGPAAPEAAPDFGTLFADAATLPDLIARGERATAQCASCHTFDAGGPNRIGPNLHDVFGRAAATHAGFEFSEPMHAHAVTWSYDTLNEFLTSPGQVVRGTKMAFAGLRRTEDRVAVIAYLRSISPNNVPLPPPAPAPVTAEAPAAPGSEATPEPAPAPAGTPPG
ncbi:MAG: cytochrome c family protein [Terricaulis sp.]